MNLLFALLYGGTLALLMVGAQLQVLKQALVCPDWPLCFGEFLPLYMTPAFYESLHRFLAVLMGVGSLAWAMSLWKTKGVKALLPLFLIILQSLLGLATFLYKLPTITTVLHLVFSLLFLASLEGTRPLEFSPELKKNWNPHLKDIVGIFLFFLVFQFILGGILRKSSLLASCESTMSFWSCWQKQAEIPWAGSLSLVHRLLGLLTTISGFFVMMHLGKSLPKWKLAPMLGLVFLVGQLTLGIQMGRGPAREMILGHFALALGCFCILVFLLVRLRKAEWFLFGSPRATYFNDVMELFKPKLTILVVVTVLVGVFIAPGQMNLIQLILSLAGIWVQAAGSLSLNCYLEREADKHMERTKNRPLPAGRLKPIVALYWGWGFIALGTLLLTLSANILTAFLGLFAALSYLYIYTPMKMKSPYALYVGAVPGALPTIMGWTTVMNSMEGMGTYLFGILFLWQIPHFMAISLYRKNEYSMAQFLTFAQTHSSSFLKLNIFLYSLLLSILGILPYLWGWRNEGYLYSSMMIGVILSVWGAWGWFTKDQITFSKWARSYFWATLFYLPLQLGVLLILR